MVKVDKLFFELLQVALGNRERLSKAPSGEEWTEIYAESERQAVTGILLYGIERLKNLLQTRKLEEATRGRANADLNLNIEMLLQWIGVGQMIEQQNRLLDERCVDLLGRIQDAGLHGTILKGQGIARLYNVDDNLNLDKKGALGRLRQSGDIDVYVDCGLKKALAFAKSQGLKDVEWDYKHLHLNLWEDIEVEMHYRVEVLLNLWKNRKLQKWFEAHTDEIFGHTDNTETIDISSEHELPSIDHKLSINGSLNTRSSSAHLLPERHKNFTNSTNGLVTPTVEFNVFYILLHIYRHFLYEGIGMRQIVDYYFVLKRLNLNANDNLKSNTNHTNRANFAIEAVKEFGMEKFASGLMWVMKESLGMPEEWMLWEPDQKEGKYILKQVMTGGNFGHYDERLNHGGGKIGTVKAILTHNLHLLTHYPSDVIWAPVWILWHKLWKVTRRV